MASTETLLWFYLSGAAIGVGLGLVLRKRQAAARLSPSALATGHAMLLAGLFVAGATDSTVLAIIAAGLSADCAYEAAQALDARSSERGWLAILCAATTGATCFVICTGMPAWSVVTPMTAVCIISIIWLRSGGGEPPLLLLLLFPLLPLGAFCALLRQPEGAALTAMALMLVRLFVETTLLAGQRFGKTPAFAGIASPLTVEGLMAGGACLVAGSLAFVLFLTDWPVTRAAIIAGLIFLSTIMGHFGVAAIKRRAGIATLPLRTKDGFSALEFVNGAIIAAPALGLVMMTL